MPLDQLDIRDHYRSGTNDLVSEFYMPCLGAAIRYDRAVGYFNSGSLKLALRGISRLLINDGTIRLIISPALTAEDLRAIEEGYAARDAIDNTIERTTRELLSELPDRQLELLRWLIAESRLDIRVATLTGPRPAIYHEKFGIFNDDEGGSIVFVGSSNETVSGLLANFESIEVFCSWNPSELARVRRRQRNFEDLWKTAREPWRLCRSQKLLGALFLIVVRHDRPSRHSTTCKTENRRLSEQAGRRRSFAIINAMPYGPG